MWFDLACDLPGDRVFDIEESLEFSGILDRRREAEAVDFENLGLDGDAIAFEVVAADDDVVCIERLGDADGGGACGAKICRKTEVIEGEEAVVAGDGEEAGGTESLVEGVGERVADPVEVGVSGAVVEGKDEDDVTSTFLFVGFGADLGVGAQGKEERGGDDQTSERRFQHELIVNV